MFRGNVRSWDAEVALADTADTYAAQRIRLLA
jgi:hypothetical protein